MSAAALNVYIASIRCGYLFNNAFSVNLISYIAFNTLFALILNIDNLVSKCDAK